MLALRREESVTGRPTMTITAAAGMAAQVCATTAGMSHPMTKGPLVSAAAAPTWEALCPNLKPWRCAQHCAHSISFVAWHCRSHHNWLVGNMPEKRFPHYAVPLYCRKDYHCGPALWQQGPRAASMMHRLPDKTSGLLPRTPKLLAGLLQAMETPSQFAPRMTTMLTWHSAR